MQKSKLDFKVQYCDTDAYKVAWHGAYLRYMEAGRVDWLYLNGVDIKELDEKQNIIMPVVEIDIKYKQSAKLLDDVTVETDCIELNNLYIIFEQTIKNKNTNTLLVYAKVKGVAVKDGKIYKKLKELVGE